MAAILVYLQFLIFLILLTISDGAPLPDPPTNLIPESKWTDSRAVPLTPLRGGTRKLWDLKQKLPTDNSIHNFISPPYPHPLNDRDLDGSGSGSDEQVKLGSEVKESPLVSMRITDGQNTYTNFGEKSISRGMQNKKTNSIWLPHIKRKLIKEQNNIIVMSPMGNFGKKKNKKNSRSQIISKAKRPSQIRNNGLTEKGMANQLVRTSKKNIISKNIPAYHDVMTNEVLKGSHPFAEYTLVKLVQDKRSGNPDLSYQFTVRNEVREDIGESGSGEEVVVAPDGKMTKHSAYNVIDHFMEDDYVGRPVPIDTNRVENPMG